MAKPVKIMIVEDEMLIGAKISMLLSDMGYEISGIIPTGERAVKHAWDQNPDIILMDITLKGKLDGIETAQLIQQKKNIPLIYLTSNTDDHHFNRAKSTRPFGFISKPFKRLDLQRAIELTLARLEEDQTTQLEDAESHYTLDDRLFIKDNGEMKKVLIRDILYLEADRNYSQIYTSTKSVLVSITLKTLEQKLPSAHFLRVHRSFIVNCALIDSIADAHLLIGQKLIPVSKSLKPELMRRVNTI